MQEEDNIAHAVVRAVDAGMATVEVQQGCGRCHEEGGCGGQQLTRMFAGGPPTFCVENRIGAAVGDHVLVALASGGVRRSANLAYGIPLLGLLVGAFAGNVAGGDLGAIIGAASGLGAAFLLVAQRQSPAMQPQLLAIRPEGENQCAR